MCEKNFTGNNYRTFSRDVQLKIDENVAEKVIPADDSVRLLDQIAFYFATAPKNIETTNLFSFPCLYR